jgi:hypothetical protein
MRRENTLKRVIRMCLPVPNLIMVIGNHQSHSSEQYQKVIERIGRRCRNKEDGDSRA